VARPCAVSFDATGLLVPRPSLATDALDQNFRCRAFLFCLQHGGSAVSVVGADVAYLVTAHFLEPDPDISLDVFQQMSDVNGAIGVGQGAGDEDASCHRSGLLKLGWREMRDYNRNSPIMRAL